mmetsp:Transcript_4602/g.10149  ORF Transcript_4602/g.10149 Transcript_4602/m.10149 type:complete len:204 (+) Transcript_4602:520-1131(+)
MVLAPPSAPSLASTTCPNPPSFDGRPGIGTAVRRTERRRWRDGGRGSVSDETIASPKSRPVCGDSSRRDGRTTPRRKRDGPSGTRPCCKNGPGGIGTRCWRGTISESRVWTRRRSRRFEGLRRARRGFGRWFASGKRRGMVMVEMGTELGMLMRTMWMRKWKWKWKFRKMVVSMALKVGKFLVTECSTMTTSTRSMSRPSSTG